MNKVLTVTDKDLLKPIPLKNSPIFPSEYDRMQKNVEHMNFLNHMDKYKIAL